MKSTVKRLFTILLSAALLVTSMPSVSFAEDRSEAAGTEAVSEETSASEPDSAESIVEESSVNEVLPEVSDNTSDNIGNNAKMTTSDDYEHDESLEEQTTEDISDNSFTQSENMSISSTGIEIMSSDNPLEPVTGLVYNGESHQLIKEFMSSTLVVHYDYSLDGYNWYNSRSDDKPESKIVATDAGTYKVHYRKQYYSWGRWVTESGSEKTIEVTIAPAPITGNSVLKYNDTDQYLLSAVSSDNGIPEVSMDNNNWYSSDSDIRTHIIGHNAGEYIVYYRLQANPSIVGSIKVSIAKADIPSGAVKAASGLVYNGKAQNLMVENLPEGCNAYYKSGYLILGLLDETDTIPQGTDVKPNKAYRHYYVYYRIDGGQNYNSTDYSSKIEVGIDPAPLFSIELNEALPYTYNGSSQSVSIKKVWAGKDADNLVEVPSDYYEISGITEATAAGEYTIKVTSDTSSFLDLNLESQNFKNDVTISTTWAINKSYTFTDGALKIKSSNGEFYASGASYEYRVGGITPGFTVEADGETLTLGEDYELVVSDSVTTAENIGTYTIKVKGIDKPDTEEDYAGQEASATWTITQTGLDKVGLNYSSTIYSGSSQIPEIAGVTDSNGKAVDSSAYTVKYKNSLGTEITEAKDAGTYTVEVTAKSESNYSGTVTATWEITKANISSDAITAATDLVYNGAGQYLVVENLPAGCKAYYKVASGTVSNPDELDYTPIRMNPDTYRIYYRIDGGNNYNDVSYKSFDINGYYNFKVTISKAPIVSIEFDQEAELPYTYNYFERSVTIKEVKAGKEGGLVTVSTGDYTISGDYTGKAAGTYSVTVTADADSNFTGSYKREWTINKSYSFTDGALTIEGSDGNYSVSDADYEYTGSDIEPDIRVEADGWTLTEGEDYEVVLEENKYTRTGTEEATYTIKVQGIGDYAKESNVATATWSITKINLGSVELDKTNVTYTGENQLPTVTKVTDSSGNVLTSDDYDISYINSNDETVTEIVNAGTYKVVATGKGKYSGYDYTYFTVDKADLPDNAVVAAKELVYNGKAQNLVVENLPEGCNAYYKVAYELLDSMIDSLEESDAIPTGTNVKPKLYRDHYYVYYRVDGGQNYNNKDYNVTTNILGGRDWKEDFEVEISPAPLYSIEFNETLPYEYNGNKQSVSIKVLAGKDADNLVEVPSDYYNISGTTEATAVGEYTVTVSCKEYSTIETLFAMESKNYTASKSDNGTVSATWNINKSYKFLTGALKIRGSDGEYTVDGASYSYKGENITPDFVVEADGETLKQNEDYVVVEKSTTTAENVGTYTIKVKGIDKPDTEDDYAGQEASATWTITQTGLDKVTLKDTSFVYNEESQIPEITGVTDSNGKAVDSSAYTVKYKNSLGTEITEAKDAGTYTVEITAKSESNYSGTSTATWEITKANISPNAVTAVTGLIYNGKDQKLVAENLPAGCNAYYKVATGALDIPVESDDIPTGKNAGSYRVYYRISGGNNYNDVDYLGLVAGKQNFDVTIDKASLKLIEFNEELPYTYDGSEKSVSVKRVMAGKDGDLVEVPSIYYKESTGSVKSATRADTYKVLIEDTLISPNFTGSCEGSWTIKRSYRFAEGALTIKGSDDEYATVARAFEFTGEDITPEIRVEADGWELEKGRDYEVVSTADQNTAKEIGSYTIKVEGRGDYSNTENQASATWSITHLQLKEATLEYDSIMYDGTVLIPDITAVKDSKGNTVAASNYTVSYKNSEGTTITEPVNAGTYTVVITANEGSNYAGSVEVSYEITKSDYLVKNKDALVTANTDLKYNGKEQELVTIASELSDPKFNGVEFHFKTNVLEEGTNSIPTGKDAYTDQGVQKQYPVYYRILGGNNYISVSYPGLMPNFTITIAKGDPTVTINPVTGLVYNGSSQKLIDSASVDFGILELNYRRAGDEDWILTDWAAADDIDSFVGTDAGTYEIGYRVAADVNWNELVSDGETNKYVEAVISAKALASEWITYKNVVWSGEEQTVEFAVTDPVLGELVKDTDYTVEGDTSATDPGEYTVTIKGCGNYSGEISFTWKILDIKAVLNETEFTYNGSYQAVTIVVSKVDGSPLTEDEDYVVLTSESTLKAIDAGTYTVKVKGKGDFETAGVFELTWKILPAQLAYGDISFEQSEFIWTGSTKTAKASVKHTLGSNALPTILTVDKDYVFTEDSVFSASDAGDYTVSVKGIGNYTGEISATWKIQGISIGVVVPRLKEDTYSYNGSEISPEVVVGLNLNILKEEEDYVIEGDLSAVNAGTYAITVRGKGKYYGTQTLNWRINPRSISGFDVTLVNKTTGIAMDTYEYFSTGITTYSESMILTDAELNNTVLVEGTDYTLSGTLECKSNEKGVYTIRATGTGNYTGSVEGEWVVAELSEMVRYDDFRVVNDDAVYTGKEIKPQLQYRENELDEWKDIDLTRYSVTDDNGNSYENIGEVDFGTYTLYIKGITSNGKYGSKDITWSISKRQLTVTWDRTETVYDGTVQRPVLKIDGLADEDKSHVTISEAKAVSLTSPQHAGTYKMYSVVEFDDDFNMDNYDLGTPGYVIGDVSKDFIRKLLNSSLVSDSVKKELEEALNSVQSRERVFYTDFTINKRTVGVSWANTELIYNGYSQKPDATATNVIDGDYCNLEVTGEQKNVGKYTANVTGLSSATELIGDYVLGTENLSCDYEIFPKNISDSSIVAIQNVLDVLIYNTASQTPEISVSDIVALDTLDEGTDYEISIREGSVTEATDAGEYTLYISGLNNYTGETEVTWSIYRRNILSSNIDISLSSDQLVYNGQEQGPEITVKYNDVKLEVGSDYTLSGTLAATDVYDIVGVTDYTTYITGTGNYVGTTQRDWDIIPLDLGTVNPEVKLADRAFNGNKQMPEAESVVVNGNEIPLDELEFTDDSAATSAGIHGATLKGDVKLNQFLCYNVTGEYSLNWEIKSKNSVEEGFDIAVDSYTYNGCDHEATISIVDKDTGVALVRNVDYKLTGDVVKKDAGTYKVTIEFMGDYSGSFDKEWTIDQADLSADALETAVSADDLIFNNETQTVAESVKVKLEDGEVTLVKGTDYTVSGANYGKNIGEYTFTVTGIGNYKGSVKKSWNIQQVILSDIDLEGSVKAKITAEDPTFNNETQTVAAAVKVTLAGKEVTLIKGTDYTISGNNYGKNVGEYTFTVTGIGNYKGSVEKSWNIVEADLSADALATAVEASDLTFNNETQTVVAAVKVTLAGKEVTLIKGTDYTISDNNYGKNVGEYTFTVTGIGNYKGSVKKSWNMLPADFTEATINIAELTYNGKAQKPEVTAEITLNNKQIALTEGTDYVLKNTESEDFGTVKNVGEYDVVIEGIGNYSGSLQNTVTVLALDVTELAEVNTEEKAVYTSTDLKPEVVIQVVLPGDEEATTLTENTDYTVIYSNNHEIGTAGIEVTFINNYTGTAGTEFEIVYGETHSVNFYVDGELYDSQTEIPHEGTVSRPANPTKEGYVFAGWTIATDGADDEGQVYIFDSKLIRSLDLEARWVATVDKTNIEFRTTSESLDVGSNIDADDIPLTTEEEQAVADGRKLDVIVEIEIVKAKDADGSSDVEELLKSKQSIGTYLEITIKKYIDGEFSGEIHETNLPVTFTVNIPVSMRVEGREYGIARVHNSVAEIIAANEKPDADWNISFSSDRFSTYALILDDSNIKEKTSVNTGDSNNIYIWAGMFTISLIALAGCSIRRKKEEEY